MIGVDRLLTSLLSTKPVLHKTHAAVRIYGSEQQNRVGVHEPSDSVQEHPDVVKVFDHFAGDNDIKGFIDWNLLQSFQIRPIQIFRAVRGENVETCLIEIKTIQFARVFLEFKMSSILLSIEPCV